MTSGVPQHPAISRSTIVDTHTHLLSVFALYRSKYPEGEYETAFDIVKDVYEGVETVVDVWCEPEVFILGTWKEFGYGGWEGIDSLSCARTGIRLADTDSRGSWYPAYTGGGRRHGENHEGNHAQEPHVYLDRLPFKPTFIFSSTFTASPFGLRLIEYVPNLHIGVTKGVPQLGRKVAAVVVCCASNLNTAELLEQMSNKRILLESDVPYMGSR
ncbi:hypothetical protein EV421DRAFT_1737158 [Armillaria borealis]|uniref:Uncharacterized protein n=1 Tax=Armillaria borealis TaxID=47425 RepID=A0AA39JEY8_9AGAR|nr:hypothetical protein EV421DRAFT_1737158 [Armillaria borealis]